jgi:HlyD family secretion protein
VTATGVVSPLVTVLVGSQVSGRVQEILVNFNSEVKKGQVLAKIDPQVFAANVEQSRAAVAGAKAGLGKARAAATNAKKRLSRLREVAKKRLIAETEIDQAVSDAEGAYADVVAAAAKVEEAKAALRQAEVNLGYTTIVSPVQGVVISRSVDVGQTVAASLQAPTLFTIAEDLRKMQVDTSVAESDVGKLSQGMSAEFSVDAYPTQRFRGVVREVRNSPQMLQNVVTYDAVVDVDNADLKLRPGMTAAVEFVFAERKSALRLANAALRYQPPGQQDDPLSDEEGQPRGKASRSIWILDGKAPKKVEVTLGVSNGALSELLSGAREGDRAVIDASADNGDGAPAPRKKLF